MFKKSICKLLIFFLFSIMVSCSGKKGIIDLPKEKYYSFKVTFDLAIENDSLIFRYDNPSYSPLRFYLNANDSLQQQFLKKKELNLITLHANEKKEFKLKNTLNFTNKDLNTFEKKVLYGDLKKEADLSTPISLPFPKGKTYSILQGNNTSFTHNTEESRYAVDFKMNIGQEVSAVYNGIVVASIDQYTIGGKNKHFEPYGNYITIYHENIGTYSIYFHLMPKGSKVKPGEKVKQNQVIGYSGHTGYSTEPHLHFVYSIPDENIGLISVPFEFIGVSKSVDLKKHTNITHVE